MKKYAVLLSMTLFLLCACEMNPRIDVQSTEEPIAVTEEKAEIEKKEVEEKKVIAETPKEKTQNTAEKSGLKQKPQQENIAAITPLAQAKAEEKEKSTLTAAAHETMQVASNAVSGKDIKVPVYEKSVQEEFIAIIEGVEEHDYAGPFDTEYAFVSITFMNGEEQTCYQFCKGLVYGKTMMKIAWEEQWYSCDEAVFERLCELTISAYNTNEVLIHPEKPNIIVG